MIGLPGEVAAVPLMLTLQRRLRNFRGALPDMIVLGAVLGVIAACQATPSPSPPRVVTSIPTPAQVAGPTQRPSPSPPPPTLTPAPTLAPSPTPEPTQPPLEEGQGRVVGTLCYPSSLPPPMTLYLKNMATADLTEVDIAMGQTRFSADLPPGDYTAYAHTVGTEVAGAYSQAAVCNGPGCTDHSLLPFQVEAGQVTENIDLCDWYRPPGVTPWPESAGAKPGDVRVTTLQNMHVYTSPTLIYPHLEIMPPLTSARALARSADGFWLQVDYPAGRSAWIYGPLVQVTGQPEALPVIEEEALEAEGAPGTDPQFTPAAWSASPNLGLVHFKGSIKDSAGRPVNGFSILFENGTWSVLTHPTGASRHYPDVPEGEWDLLIMNETDAAGWWVLTVVSYDCPDFEEGFNAQCKSFTRLSEPQIVKIVYPNRTVIRADWLCQRDCDQGLYQEPYRP